MIPTSITRCVFDRHDEGNLVVVICHFNPCAYENPKRNLHQVLSWLATQDLPVYAVELRCGESLADEPLLPSDHEKVIQLESKSVFFRKENLWNIAARRLPDRFQWVLCLDADVIIKSGDWLLRLQDALRSNKIVQPFSRAAWMDSRGRVYREKVASLSAAIQGLPNAESGKIYHPGFAVAIHRKFWIETNGLYNGILGEGASAMMAALLGAPESMNPYFGGISAGFGSHYSTWANMLTCWTGGRFSAIEAIAFHFWHGSTARREYVWHSPEAAEEFQARKAWLTGFNPESDLAIDPSTGLLEWSSQAVTDKTSLIRRVEQYFRRRNEDEWYDSLER